MKQCRPALAGTAQVFPQRIASTPIRDLARCRAVNYHDCMTTEPDDKRELVLRWVQTVTASLDERNRADSAAYQQLSPSERWKLVGIACHQVVDRLDDSQGARLDERAEEDARRFGALMRDIRERMRE